MDGKFFFHGGGKKKADLPQRKTDSHSFKYSKIKASRLARLAAIFHFGFFLLLIDMLCREIVGAVEVQRILSV